jgi:Tol biopolymer transport system component
MGLDGKAERITFDRRSFDQTLSPDGKRIAFGRAPAGAFKEDGYEKSAIAVAAATSGAKAKTWRTRHFDGVPSWSPRGGRIAFTRSRPPASRPIRRRIAKLLIARPDGSDQRVVVRGAVSPWTPPAWSNRGDHIAYVTADEPPEIRIIDTDGDNGRTITVLDGERYRTTNLDWSPDDTHLLLSEAGFESPIGVRELDLRTGDTRVVSTTGTNARYLSDGRIVFLELVVTQPQPVGHASPQFLMVEGEAGPQQLVQLSGVELAGSLEDRCVPL